jgi:hypothetical protein
MALTSSMSDGPLLIGPVRAYPDHKADWIVIETAKDNPHGFGKVVCWVPMSGMADARMIKALPDLIKDAEPFAALGRELAEGDSDAPLIIAPTVKLEITVGDLQRIAVACAKAFPPKVDKPPGVRVKRRSGRKHKPT